MLDSISQRLGNSDCWLCIGAAETYRLTALRAPSTTSASACFTLLPSDPPQVLEFGP